MRLLSGAEYESLIAGGEVLRSDGFGPKVYGLRDTRIVKVFRIKRLLSLSLVYPYSVRFSRNATRLERRGFTCVRVTDVFYCHAVRRHGVVYERLAGEPLDLVFAEGDARARETLIDSARYIAELHRKHVYFRSLHPGNILLLPGGGFGLIDVADLRLPILPLSIAKRRRNFRHMFRSAEFRQAAGVLDMSEFFDSYLAAAGLSEKAAAQLRIWLQSDADRALATHQQSA